MKNGLIVNEFGTKYYYLNHMWHREDGPAIENPVRICYFLNDKEYSEQDYWEEIERRKEI
jgi:hypothetical protein